MLVRVATPEDAEQCVQVMVAAMAASADYGNPRPEDLFDQWRSRVSGYLEGTYHPGFAKEERTMFVAEQSGVIIAFVAGHRTLRFGCDGELQWVFVLPDWQRKGIGSSLLAMMRRWFVEHKMRKICVNASAEMETRAFYLKHGATSMGEHWCVWENLATQK